MMMKIKHDNAYAIACMIEINVITFLNRSDHRIENAIRKKENEQKKRKKTIVDSISELRI
jgi:hypothetical protein